LHFRRSQLTPINGVGGPYEHIAKNVQTMIEQLKRIGCMYDWEKMVNTSDPSYYKWTQWLFLQMFKHDLAYKKQAPVIDFGSFIMCSTVPSDST
jgi:leucyl-tRNA synthetase